MFSEMASLADDIISISSDSSDEELNVEQVQTPPNPSKPLQTSPNLSKPALTCI